jgi:cation diffusion facilitator family transporter
MSSPQSPTPHPAAQGIKVVKHGMGFNFVLAIIKGTAGFFGNSYALVADAIESASDVLSSMVVWIGLRTAARPPDEDHPYGHGKAEPVAAVIVSLFLVAASLLIAVEAIHNIQTPHPVPHSWTLWVILAVIIGKEVVFRYVMSTATAIDSTAVKGEAQHHRADAITSVAAFIGIAIALWGGEDYASADDWAALLASAFVAWNAYNVFRPAFKELMDEAQPKELVDEVVNIAMTVNGVEAIEKCFVRKMGFDYFVDIHVEVDGMRTVTEGHDIAHRVKDAIMAAKPAVYDVLTHIEPYPHNHQL